MKFTDGYWLKRAGWTVMHPRQIQSIKAVENGFTVYAPTRHIEFKGAELDASIATITVKGVSDGVIKVTVEHFKGQKPSKPQFDIHTDDTQITTQVNKYTAQVTAGQLSAAVKGEKEYELSFTWQGKQITSAILKSTGLVTSPDGQHYMHEQLTLAPSETIYGLGERFGPFVKNGQVVDMWNADGGTASEQAYKNIPFYISSQGYGVFVNHSEKVSYEVGSEVNTRVQFSVPGHKLEYFIIGGNDIKDVLSRYAKLTGKAPQVPQWSYGLWLSTSFKTDYSQESVCELIDQMRQRQIPVDVLHFDCYWMRASHWCDFVWDPQQFKDPKAMLKAIHDKGVKVCVWINPYIAQQSHLFEEGMEKGYLLKDKQGNVRQWDHWQPGMGWVDFTNPEAVTWWQNELKKLLVDGVDVFKTDFGERVPTDVVWHDGSDPMKMHNYYTYLYNKAAYEAIAQVHGKDQALVFARSATAGSQTLPVHWGGDSEPTFVSMAETLRGGLSFAMSGFGYWSHDMGGFEGKPNPAVFTRWYPFGIFSSHSRLHGSDSYRVPWIYGQEATKAAQRFTQLKNQMMPYILATAQEVSACATPIMRPMVMEFPKDMGSRYIDSQYMFGSELLVAPVFSETSEVDFYLPTAGWTNILDGSRISEKGWHKQVHELDSLPLLSPDGAVIAMNSNWASAQYDCTQDTILLLVQPSKRTQGNKIIQVCSDLAKAPRYFEVTYSQDKTTVKCLGSGQDIQELVADDRQWNIAVIDESDFSVSNAQIVSDRPIRSLKSYKMLNIQNYNESVEIQYK